MHAKYKRRHNMQYKQHTIYTTHSMQNETKRTNKHKQQPIYIPYKTQASVHFKPNLVFAQDAYDSLAQRVSKQVQYPIRFVRKVSIADTGVYHTTQWIKVSIFSFFFFGNRPSDVQFHHIFKGHNKSSIYCVFLPAFFFLLF